MKKNIWKRMLAVVLAGVMVVPLAACGANGRIQSQNLMDEVEKNTGDDIISDCGPRADESEEAVIDFAVKLFQNCFENEKNTLLSPLSVIMALSMTANGAKGDTLSQMEHTFGEELTYLNPYLSNYMENLPQGDKYKLKLANSIWFTDDERLTVNQEFLQKNANYYGADIYKTPFDNTTLKDINNWIEQKTDGMIKDMLNEIPQDAIMYLINALAFEAEWATTYEEGQVRDKTFTTEGGEKQSVKLMYSDENLYLENEQATGFIKYYKDSKYAFVALLPKEGISVEECVSELSGYELSEMLDNPQQIHVDAAIPQFETEYDILMNDVLKEMGMPDAFDAGKADFTGLGTSTNGNIYIGRVLHKTFIQVGPQGTKAGAATVVEMKDNSAPFFEETKTVHLDRPFVYMLIDCENNQPFFMGTVMEVE